MLPEEPKEPTMYPAPDPEPVETPAVTSALTFCTWSTRPQRGQVTGGKSGSICDSLRPAYAHKASGRLTARYGAILAFGVPVLYSAVSGHAAWQSLQRDTGHSPL